MTVRKGTARRVILIGHRYAVKIARLRLRNAWHYRRWRETLEGLNANRHEREKWKASRDVRLCPILFSDTLGIIVVMPYARALTDEEFEKLEVEYIVERSHIFGKAHHGDFKRENYGMLGDRVVKVDYEE